MDTFIVMPGKDEDRDDLDNSFFQPLRKLAAELTAEGKVVNVLTELKIIGVAVIEATPESVQALKSGGYSVNVNERKHAI